MEQHDAKPVYPTELTLEVKQEHLDNGKPRLPGDCALALASRDLFPGKFTSCGRDTIKVWENKNQYLDWMRDESGCPLAVYSIGDEGRRFTIMFDNRRVVQPTILTLTKELQ